MVALPPPSDREGAHSCAPCGRVRRRSFAMRNIPATEDGRPPAGAESRPQFQFAPGVAFQFESLEHTRPVRRRALRIVLHGERLCRHGTSRRPGTVALPIARSNAHEEQRPDQSTSSKPELIWRKCCGGSRGLPGRHPNLGSPSSDRGKKCRRGPGPTLVVIKILAPPSFDRKETGAPAGIRTPDQEIKSLLLYQLSY